MPLAGLTLQRPVIDQSPFPLIPHLALLRRERRSRPAMVRPNLGITSKQRLGVHPAALRK